MSKYDTDLDYLIIDIDISKEELNLIIEEAEQIITEGKSHDTKTLTEAYLKKVQCLQKLGKDVESKIFIEKLLELSPDMPEALIRLGNVYDTEKNYDQAIACFDQGLKLKPNYAYGFKMLGLTYENKQDHKNALKNFKKALSKREKYSVALRNATTCCINLNDPTQAIEYSNRLIDIDPHNALNYYLRGTVYASLNKFNEAIEDFTTSIKFKSKTNIDIAVHGSRGDIYRKIEKYDEAIADFSEIINTKSDNIDAYITRGELFFEKKDYDRALDDFSKAIELKPSSCAFCKRARVYDSKSDYKKAIEDFNKAVLDKPKCAKLFIYRAAMYSHMKDFANATKNYTKAINIEHNVCTFCERGSIYHSNDDYGKAINDFTYVIENKPECANVFGKRAEAFFFKGEYDNAINDLTKAINIKLDECFLCSRSDAYYKKNKINNAIDDLTSAIKLKPSCIEKIYGKRGLLYLETNKYSKAISDFSKALNKKPDDAESYYLRGYAFMRQHNYDAALADTNKAIELSNNNIDPRYLYGRSIIYSSMKNLKLSLLDIGKATNLAPRNSTFRNKFIYTVHKIFLNDIDLLFELDVTELYNMPHFFLKKIALLMNEGKISDEYKKLIKSIYHVWGESYSDPDNTYLYQYTSQDVLKNVIENQRLRLTPAGYLNDPLEGRVLYDQLSKYFKDSPSILNMLESIKKSNSNSIAFIRSFTSLEDNIAMWNSSYAENGNGIAIGIQKNKISSGYEIQKGQDIISSTQDVDCFSLDETCENKLTDENKTAISLTKDTDEVPLSDSIPYIQIGSIGLYEIIYVDDDVNDKSNDKIKEIVHCLSEIPKDDFSNASFVSLLSELLLSIAHLIKDRSYEHEKEFRLMYIGSIEEDRDLIQGTFEDGIYVETDSFLFKDSKEEDIVYVGPNVNFIKQQKIDHLIKHKGLYANIKHSNVPFRS